MKNFILLFICVFFSSHLLANNLQITNVSLSNQDATANTYDITFDISWENSWRLDAAPGNYDAAWIFVKFRYDGGEWIHGKILPTGSTAPGAANLDVVADNVGAFLYRASTGTGNVSYSGVTLKWNYDLGLSLKEGYTAYTSDMFTTNDPNEAVEFYDPNFNTVTKAEATEQVIVPDNAINLEVKVMGIEMVYIPEGPFYIGDGVNGWRNGDNTDPFYVTNDGEQQLGFEAGQLRTHNNLLSGTIFENVAMGYEAFYMMKYKVTLDQVLNFKNMLTRAQQGIQEGITSENEISAPPFPIKIPETFSAAGPIEFFLDYNGNGIPNEVGDGHDFVATNDTFKNGEFSDNIEFVYLNWIGLRAPSEFEFEKAARGPNTPIANEAVWGNTNVNPYNVDLFDYDGVKGSGQETLSSSQSNFAERPNYFVDEPSAPIGSFFFRSGLFADGANSRERAGASYYGVLELGYEGVIQYNSNFNNSFENGDGQYELGSEAGAIAKWAIVSQRNSTFQFIRGVRK